MSRADAKKRSAEVKEFLSRMLRAGPLPVSWVLMTGSRHGFRDAEMHVARKEMGIDSVVDSNGWVWSLPKRDEVPEALDEYDLPHGWYAPELTRALQREQERETAMDHEGYETE